MAPGLTPGYLPWGAGSVTGICLAQRLLGSCRPRSEGQILPRILPAEQAAARAALAWLAPSLTAHEGPSAGWPVLQAQPPTGKDGGADLGLVI